MFWPRRVSRATKEELGMNDMKEAIREILSEHAKLASNVSLLSDNDDLFDAGLTSLSTVTVMLALEDAFEVEFPEAMLSRRTFTSIDTINDALAELAISA
jgi:acyl carrier protein